MFLHATWAGRFMHLTQVKCTTKIILIEDVENISLICRFCGAEKKNGNSLRNHERLCRENPNRQISNFEKSKNSIRHSNQYIKALELGLPKPVLSEESRRKLSEKAKGRKHTEEWKQKASERAKKQGFGGWHASRSFDYNGIRLDSSYEVKFAEDLDKNKIKWSRPKPLLYKLNDEEHRYYPDFYLDDYGVYVDTKNDYLINHVNPKYGITDVEKINLVSQQNNVKIYILDKNNLLWSNLNLFL